MAAVKKTRYQSAADAVERASMSVIEQLLRKKPSFDELRQAVDCVARLRRGKACSDDKTMEQSAELIARVDEERALWRSLRKRQAGAAALVAFAMASLVYYSTTPEQRSAGLRRLLLLSGLSKEERRPLLQRLRSAAPATFQDAVQAVQDVLPSSSFWDVSPRSIYEAAKDALPSAARGALAAASQGASKLWT